MKRPSQNHFATVPSCNLQRSVFDQPFTYKTTLDAGIIVPCMQPIEILPGDTLNLSLTSFARLATLITPFMDNARITYFFFFVANRLVWDAFEEFICADVNGPTGTVPQIKSGSAGFPVGSLADYFGLPVNVGNIEVNALPFRAYNLIFNEWFKREDLVTDSVINTGSSDENWTDGDYPLRRRCKRADYFVQCNLWPQKGPGVELPLGGRAPVGVDTMLHPAPFAQNAPLRMETLTGQVIAGPTALAVSSSDVFYTSTAAAIQTGARPNNLWADLSQATASTINSLRTAFQLQRLYERDALANNGRYVEVLMSHFAVRSPDARLQRPEYLGGGKVNISVHTVTQTSSTNSVSPQANLAGYGVAAGRVGFNKSFVEHGYVIGLMCITSDQTYQQGIDRMWSRKGRFDYYWPVLAHLGEQAVLNKELYAQGSTVVDVNGNVVDEQPFGYQERWAEYRYGMSKITGKLRSGVSGSLDVWHLAQNFTGLPVLGETFVQENPPFDRVIAVQNEPQFIYDSVIRARFVRPLPAYSTPGWADHF